MGQDSAEALGRDLVRGIIELVTNCDDAYVQQGGRGKIWIGVEHRRGRDTYEPDRPRSCWWDAERRDGNRLRLPRRADVGVRGGRGRPRQPRPRS